MELNWIKLKEFLRSLGVEFETSETDPPPAASEEPTLRILQRAQDHEAFYRIDWTGEDLELLVLMPNNHTPLKFSVYRVQLSNQHPLSKVITDVMTYQGSEGFEQTREVPEGHLLHTIVESMKALFWVGQDLSHIPPEITVQKIC